MQNPCSVINNEILREITYFLQGECSEFMFLAVNGLQRDGGLLEMTCDFFPDLFIVDWIIFQICI